MALTITDSSLLIDFLAGDDPGAQEVHDELENGELAITALTRTEILFAAKAGRQETQIRQLLYGLLIVPIDEVISDKAIEIQRVLEKSDRRLPLSAALLAGAALRTNSRLLVKDREVFGGIPGLRVAQLRSWR